MEKQIEKELLKDIESLLVGTGTTEHEIPVDPDNPNVIIRVWTKELSFLQLQNALREVVNMTQSGEVSIDLAGYWKYMMKECIVRTEPELSTVQLYALKPEIASKITGLLPQPQDLMSGPLEDGLTA